VIALLGVCLAAGAGACGGDGGERDNTQRGERKAAFQRNLAVAQRPAKADFPPAQGKTLQQVADDVQAVKAGLATSEFAPGSNRLAFGLTTEPWLFTFTRDGRVAARLEGSFGNNSFREAVEAALAD
jgi:hypothetical protein